MLLDNDKITVIRLKDPSQRPGIAYIDNAGLQAGFPSPASDYLEGEIDLHRLLVRHPASTFIIEVTGDSMKDAFIGDPSRLVVDKSLRPQNNDIVLAVVNDEFTVKYYRTDNHEVTLYPANERYKPLRIIDGMTFYVFGVVTFTIIENRQLNRVRTHRL